MFKSYTTNDHLLLPPSFGELIPDHDPVRVVDCIIEQIDLTSLFHKYSRKKRYAIASGDERISTIYAYVENGNLSDTSYNVGLKMMLDNIPAVVSRQLNQYYGNISEKNLKRNVEISGEMQVGPFLQTKWGQREPYNNTCPAGDSCSHTLAGCTAIALAQVIAYFDTPSSRFRGIFNHTSMTASPKAYNLPVNTQNMIAKLVHYCGVKAGLSYGCRSTGGWAQRFSDFSLLGYRILYETEFNSERLAETLYIEQKPVIVVGYNNGRTIGHTWVMDGLKYVTFWPMVSCNFGWNGESDGWFSAVIGEGTEHYAGYNTYSFLYITGFDTTAYSDNKTYTGPYE